MYNVSESLKIAYISDLIDVIDFDDLIYIDLIALNDPNDLITDLTRRSN